MPLPNLSFVNVRSGANIPAGLGIIPFGIKTSGSETVLSAGSDLNRASVPWVTHIDAGTPLRISWRANRLREQTSMAVPANYGSRTSASNFSFRKPEYQGIGNYPGPVPYAGRPMYNTLTPIVWGLRVLDSQAQTQPDPGFELIQVGPAVFTPAGPASLQETLL